MREKLQSPKLNRGGVDIMKFAHLSDIHLGAFSDRSLRDLSFDAFSYSVEKCIENDVDFVLISGDFFHNPVPDMSISRDAAEKLKEFKDRGIKVFTIYGSHDYSPLSASMIDIFEKAGLISKVQRLDGKKLLPLVDKDLNISLYGIDARKNGLDQETWRSIEEIEKPPNGTIPIILMHLAIRELLPYDLFMIEALNISDLPKGMKYYALGHIHFPGYYELDGSPVVQPGALFGSDFSDLENTAKGVKRGFYIVDTDNMKPEFIEVNIAPIILMKINLDNKHASSAYDEVMRNLGKIEKDSVVLLHLEGNLSGGKQSDLQIHRIKRYIIENGARTVIHNQSQLKFPESQKAKFTGSIEEIERKILEEKISSSKIKALSVDSSLELLNILSIQKEEGERDSDYKERLSKLAMKILGVDESD